jgi:hypothetical protein
MEDVWRVSVSLKSCEYRHFAAKKTAAIRFYNEWKTAVANETIDANAIVEADGFLDTAQKEPVMIGFKVEDVACISLNML